MIRIFVGCSANHEDLESQSVLEYTIRQNTFADVDITWMQLAREPISMFYSAPEKGEGWRTIKWPTPFSGFRWGIPAYCNFQGRAIYFDSDFIVRGDVQELWEQPFQEGKIVIAKGGNRYCCSVWDCAASEQHMLPVDRLMRDEHSHERIVRYLQNNQKLVQSFATGDWNMEDFSLQPGWTTNPKIKAVHYTRVEQQVQLKYALPRLQQEGRIHWTKVVRAKPNTAPGLQEEFDKLYVEATEAGYGIERYRNPLYGPYSLRGGK